MKVIHPRKIKGRWAIEDMRSDSAPLFFELGSDEIIDRIASDIPNAENGFSLIFSDEKFAGYQIVLERKEKESDGYWYFSSELKLMGWFGAGLQRYVESFPSFIYAAYRADES